MTAPKSRGRPIDQLTIEIEHVAIEKLKPAPYNPRKMSEDARKRLLHLIREHGLVDPIIARREDKMVIGGHQRLVAAKTLGFSSVPVIYLDNLSDDRAKALTIALNNPKAQGEFDDAAAQLILAELQLAQVDVSLTGFDPAEVLDATSSVLEPLVIEPSAPTTWCLIGISTARYHEIAEIVEKVGIMQGVFCEVVASNVARPSHARR